MGTFNPMGKSAFGGPAPVGASPVTSFAPPPTPPPPPAQPAPSGYAQAMTSANKAGSTASADPRNAMTPAQSVQYTQWMGMTPQQQQDYVKGQAAGAASAGAAANTAGIRQAALVGPGGPMSAGVQADQARQTEADAAGLDFMRPGALETFQKEHGNQPLEQSGYANWLDKNRIDPNKQTMTQDFASRTLGQGHGVGDADFDKYYDRSEQNATQKLNDQLSARGTYGSSVGLGQIGSMLADMEGNRARDKAQYGLQRSADDRGWTETQGGLASSADTSGLNQWAVAGGAEAKASSEANDRWGMAMSAADQAQGAQRTRGQDFFNNNLSMGNALSGTAGSSYDAALAQDQGLVDAVISLGLGKDAESVAQIIQRANQGDAQAKQILDLAMTLKASNQPAAAKT